MYLSVVVGFLALTLLHGSVDAQNKEITVTALAVDPYVQYSNGTEGLRFFGFAVDVLDAIASKVGFTYKIELIKEGSYGSKTESGWNGMIGEIIGGRAQMTLGDLTITQERRNAVDFSYPFMTYHLRMLAKPEVLQEETILKYAGKPFGPYVWLMLFVIVVGVGLCLTLINKVDPYEWQLRQFRNETQNPEGNKDFFGLKESFWFVISAMGLQGYNKRPLSLAGRTLALFWFIFCIITVMTYLSVLINMQPYYFSSAPGARWVYGSLDELTRQSEVEYGVIRGGASMAHFKSSNNMAARRAHKAMDAADSYVASLEEGIERVKKGDFVFITDSTTVDFITRQSCELVGVDVYDEKVSEKGFGFGFPIGSELRKDVDLALLSMIDDGAIDNLQMKWWSENPSCPKVVHAKDLKTIPEPLKIDAFWGPVIFLIIGVILSVVLAVAETIRFNTTHSEKEEDEEGKETTIDMTAASAKE